ncbi:MAG: FtsQ-type POTRA domain-containing protein [Oscillospiraceae bacterium]|nr:FtsQ-type POTRA domain-containing protein [Oscillospiraceae bacterium]
MSLHYSAVVLIVLIIFSVLSVTVLFNIETAVVIGSSIYTAEEIIGVSGIRGGDNMVRKNLGKAENAITSELVYIEEAKITRKLPSSVEIVIVPCVETASLQDEGGFMIVSETGKILRLSEEPAEDTQVFYGVNPAEELKIGDTFKSEDEAKTEVIYELMALSENQFVSEITSFDVSDRLNISCVYDNRIDIMLGVITDAEYKFRLAKEIISTRISPGAEGRLKMLENGGQFLSKADLEQIEETFIRNSEAATETVTEETSAEPSAGTSEDTNTSTKLNFE